MPTLKLVTLVFTEVEALLGSKVASLPPRSSTAEEVTDEGVPSTGLTDLFLLGFVREGEATGDSASDKG